MTYALTLPACQQTIPDFEDPQRILGDFLVEFFKVALSLLLGALPFLLCP